MSVLGVVCPECHAATLEKGDGLYAGLFTCPFCKRSIGRMVLAVDLINAGWEACDAAEATGMTLTDIERNLRVNYRLERKGTREYWVDKGSFPPATSLERKESFVSRRRGDCLTVE